MTKVLKVGFCHLLLSKIQASVHKSLEYVKSQTVDCNVTSAILSFTFLFQVQESWQQLKSIVHKLGKQSKKDGKTSESHAFQALFLELGFHLFRDPEHIPEVLEVNFIYFSL